jgi:hypothetical protein
MDVGGVGHVRRTIRFWTKGVALLASAGACHADPGPSTATLTVERLVSGCYVPCMGSSAPNSGIPIGDRCPDSTPVACGFVGGTDEMRVVADYGEIDIASASTFAGPTMQLIGDGIVLSNVTLVPGALSQGGQRPYAFAVVQVPDIGVLALVAKASVGGGDTVQASGTFNVTPQPGTIALPGCPTAPATCTHQLQVGTQSVTVTVPSNVSAQAATVQSLVDGVPQALTLQIPLTAIGGNQVSGTQSLPVPAAGATWTVTGFVGTLSLGAQQISLVPPTLTTSLEGCGAGTCTVAAGGTVTLAISAPLGSEVTTAAVVTSVDGVDTGGTFSATLAPCPGDVDCGTVVVPLSGSPGSLWQARTTVGLFAAPALTARIVAPADSGAAGTDGGA